MKHVLLPVIALLGLTAHGQLVIDNATFFIGEGATVTVQGDLTTNTTIQAGGTGASRGKIAMKGSSLQTISAGTNVVIPHLEIDNTSHVVLASDLRVGNRLNFVGGRLRTAANHLILPSDVEIAGAAAGRFIETNGTGTVRQLTPANMVSTRMLPIGNGTHYSPVSIQLTGATGHSANSFVAVRSTGEAIPTPARHPRTESFINTAWVVNGSGYTGGNIAVTGTYTDGQIQAGSTEADLRGMWWNGTTWSLAGGTQNAAANTVGATVPGTTGGTVYGMNRFLLANVKAHLQAVYVSNTGLMNDNLRQVGNVVNNLIPLSDPYRTAPISTNFTHMNNGVTETVAASVFNNAANVEQNIVDWVFVELRNITSPTTAPVVQTRSVLVNRNGDLVDVDGQSPVYFKNVDAGNYAISVRHRNHLGISTNPAVPIALSLTPTMVNFGTLPTGSLFGTANSNYARVNNVNLLYAGNTNGNANVRFGGPGNDKDAILSLGTGGVATAVISNVYNVADVNMNRNVRFGGPANDKDFIISTPLNSVSTAIRSQSLPN